MAAMKCCSFSICNQVCLDPVGLTQCIHNGVVYEVGQHFRPNACTECRCEADHTSGNSRFGGAVCQVEDCPVLDCPFSQQQTAPGACCPHCNVQVVGDALHFLNCPTEPIVVSLGDRQRTYLNEFTRQLEVEDRRQLGRSIQLTQTPSSNIMEWIANDRAQTVMVVASARDPNGHMDTASCSYSIIVNGRFSLSSADPKLHPGSDFCRSC